MTRVLVTGSRTWNVPGMIRDALRAVHDTTPGPHTLIHGAARGADRIAAHEATRLGWRIEAHPVPPEEWRRQGGRAAGRRRNAAMVAAGADICLAFLRPCDDPACQYPSLHDSHGATHCAGLAEKAGIPTRRYLT